MGRERQGDTGSEGVGGGGGGGVKLRKGETLIQTDTDLVTEADAHTQSRD